MFKERRELSDGKNITFLLLYLSNTTLMAFPYLEGGKTLEGVTTAALSLDGSNFSYSSESSFSACSSSVHYYDGQEQHHHHQLTIRRLGLSSEEFARHLLKSRNEHPQHIAALDASRNQISTLQPSLLQCFTHLTQLNLCCNNLSVIPEVILGLEHLQQLYLSENQIDAIPEAMPICLTELMVLNLDSNRIKVLPESIGQWKRLREFRLGSEYGGNLIEVLPEAVSEMQALVELDLSFNNLQHVGTTWRGLQKLKYLNLSHNRIKYMPILADDCCQLSTLDLSDNLIRTIPHAVANSVLRLMLNCQLQLLNLSNNRLQTVPTEMLDQAQTQVIIQGNPLTSSSLQQYQDLIVQDEDNEDQQLNHITQQNDTQTVRDLIQTAIPMMDYRLHQEDHEETHSMTEDQPDPVTHDSPTTTTELDKDHSQPIYLVRSLREIALRSVVMFGDPLLLSDIPQHLAEDIRENLQLCPHCHSPFIHEWVSTVQLRTYQSHRSVPRQIRFCRTECWLAYKNMLQQEALAAQSEVHVRQQRQDALTYIAQHGNMLEPGSFEWVMAASLAATAQEEQADLLANAMMMM